VHVKAWLLKPETFGSAPLFLLSTDIPENDDVSRAVTRQLYDPNESTRIAQSIILGIGGAMLLDILQIEPAVYHMNEGHSLPLNFYLYARHNNNLDEVKKRVVFTTHTPEMAGNEEHDYSLLKEMSFFYHMQVHEVQSVLGMEGDRFNYTLAALKFARKANGVSKLHGEVARQMWGGNAGICEIISITNAQNKTYWKDAELDEAISKNDDERIIQRKKNMKSQLFKTVADQCGKLFNENTLTIVWARRFAGYKRADIMMYDWERFLNLVNNTARPVQIIWAGKPYPEDYGAVDLFNQIISRVKPLSNCVVLTGYELSLSALLKKGADVWLNTPRMYREASGTSGMTAAINGAINVSLPDGWIPEFAKDKENCYVIQPADDQLPTEEKDRQEARNLMDTLENSVVPAYYDNREQWLAMLKKAATDIVPAFEAGRMTDEYYEKMYKN
jgi:starch phosphorylase